MCSSVVKKLSVYTAKLKGTDSSALTMCEKMSRVSGDRHGKPSKFPEEKEQDREIELLYSFI